ncbi:MAG TPA: DUF2752 domain-containing protein [Bacteroidales bacterium]|nr:DUF2752 domain-containing protein [Bacteroidales bacterium]
MILHQRKSNLLQTSDVKLRKEPYILINIIFAGVILMIFAYSGIFSPVKDNYPVQCIHERITGEPCISCGLSHSFSLIVRGKTAEALKWNPYGLRVFLFFISQLVLRAAFTIYYISCTNTRKQLVLYDCIGSVLIFLISFRPFIAGIVSGILSI